MILQAQPLTATAFSPFGRVFDLRGEAVDAVAAVSGEGWTDLPAGNDSHMTPPRSTPRTRYRLR